MGVVFSVFEVEIGFMCSRVVCGRKKGNILMIELQKFLSAIHKNGELGLYNLSIYGVRNWML